MSTQVWRWDQGRLAYFSFNNLRLIAASLAELDGVNLRDPRGDPLRSVLESGTGLPFLPKHYTVWRNYARVFGCAFLATSIDARLAATDVCRRIGGTSGESWDIDEYLSFIISRFYYPSPVFQNYDPNAPQVFPFCCVLRYLIAKYREGKEARVTLNEIFSRVVGNECRGTEPIDAYAQLGRTGYQPKGDERRQLREMLIFISQCSFLKWYGNTLYLDVLPGDVTTAQQLEQIATPVPKERNANPRVELLSLGAIVEFVPFPAVTSARELPSDITFTEGRRVRVTHLRIERSPRLRRLYLSRLPEDTPCDMCLVDMRERYPWVDSMLEVHHLLPLSSAIAMTGRGISFDDLVPLCPTCHKSVHAFYKTWLHEGSHDDFPSVEDARAAYGEVKELFPSGGAR